MTSDGALSVFFNGQRGSLPAKCQSSSRPKKTRKTDSTTDDATKKSTPGAKNDMNTNQRYTRGEYCAT